MNLTQLIREATEALLQHGELEVAMRIENHKFDSSLMDIVETSFQGGKFTVVSTANPLD